jgi:hypothetical protein
MILGLFTSSGIAKTIEAQNNEGFKIYPQSFSISRTTGALAPSRIAQNAGTWFTAEISSRVVIDYNSIKIICTIPPESSLVVEDVKEVCVFAKDANNNDFLLAVGQPTEEIIYDPSGTVTLELQISLADTDLTSLYVFNNTKAVELSEHVTDPNAHPEVMEVLAKYGITVEGGAYAKERMGQPIEFPCEFEGTKATFTHGGVVWTAKFNGTELNNKTIVFDGLKSNDEIRADFNAANYPNTVEHDGAPTGVSVSATKTLVGGTYSLVEKDIVYKDVDGVYKRALADGSEKSRLVGVARLSKKMVVGPGFVDINTGEATGTPLYLSGTSAGKISTFNTNIGIGVCLGDHIFFTGYAGDASTDVAQEFDAVVTDAAGVGQFATTQQAIDFVPNNGRILVKKQELIKQTILTGSKNLSVVFNHANTGWKRFLGQATIFNLTFNDVPTQGSFRIEWLDQETNDIPYNANAALIQTEFNQLSGHNGFTVTGNFTTGFTFVSNDLQVYPLPTFTYVGRNEIQKFTFSAVPDNGTTRFEFNGQQTTNYAFNDNLAQLQAAFDALSTTINVEVTGSFASGFTVEFKGGWLQDGNKEQNAIKAVTNYLYANSIPVNINGKTAAQLPVEATILQKGKTPASNLYNGTTLLNISTTMIQTGEEVGPDRLMEVSSDILKIEGLGLIEDFREGLVLGSSNTLLTLSARTNLVDRPVLLGDRLPTVNHDIELMGYAKDVVAQLRLTEHATDKKRLSVSGMDFVLPSGIMMAKTLDSLKAKFDGAEIDFINGKVYDKDSNDIGLDFVPPSITPTNWKWFSINVVITGTDNGTNEATVGILVLPAASEGTDKELAPKPPTDDNPVGLVALRGSLGEKHKVEITTVRDHFTHQLEGTTITFYHPSNSVAFFFEDPANPTTVPAQALAADRYVKMTGMPNNAFQSVVAQKLQEFVNADPDFTATVSGNKVTVENTVLGDVSDVDLGNTGFFSKTLVEGTDTDSAGFDDISNENIIQFSTGSGSGGGSFGVGSAFLVDLKAALENSYYSYLDYNIFQLNKDKKLDFIEGSYLPTKKFWELNTGESLISVDHLDIDYKESLTDLDKVSITLNYDRDFRDPSPLVEVSRDGGINFQVVNLTVNNAGLVSGEHTFTEEATVSELNKYALSNADSSAEFNATSRQSIGQEFTTGSIHPVIKKLTFYVNKAGSPSGTIGVKIVKDNGGSPSENANDFVWAGQPKLVSGIASGDSVLSFNVSGLVLSPNTKYHAVLYTSSAYKTSFVTGTTRLSLRGDASSPTVALGKIFNGSAWSNSVQAACHIVEGRVLDLRVMIVSSTDNAGLVGYGVFYGKEAVSALTAQKRTEIQYFSGSLNKNSFTLNEIIPNPDYLEVAFSKTGQIWKYPAFDISGKTVTFPAGTFNFPNESLNLRFDQHKGGAFDNSDTNLGIITENHLYSADPSLDKSAAGRGWYIRRPDGVVREVTLNNNDEFEIWSI